MGSVRRESWHRRHRWFLAAGLGLGCSLVGSFAQEAPRPAQAVTPPPAVIPPSSIQLVQEKPAPQPPPAPQPTPTPDSLPETYRRPDPGTGGGGFGSVGLPTDYRRPGTAGDVQPPTAAVASVTTSNEAALRATTDAGSLLGSSPSATGVETQKRSPIANEARIRGQRLGQITTHADGAYWFTARLDLDTFLSKIDSGIIQDIIVVKGPYSARYGPGLSFIDISTEPSFRNPGGPFEGGGRSFASYKTNGEQLYGRQSFWGGSDNWGFRMSYGHRTGNDYTTGAGMEIPASYNARDVDFVYGYDFTPVSRVEIGYLRLDQTGLEFPGQIFDTRFLVTDGTRLRYVLEQQQYFDRLVFDTWYNYTRLEGDAQRTGKRRQIPELQQSNFIGRTDIDLGSLGYRLAVTWGVERCPQLTIGTDLRRLNGHLNEFDSLQIETFGNVLPCGFDINFPVPRSHQTVLGGLFAEYVLPYDDCLLIKMGARGDYVTTDIDSVPPGFTCAANPAANLPIFEDTTQALIGARDDFERDFALWLAYATAEYKLTQNWTLVGGLGHAERPPTTTELYALQPFLAILQQGFTAVQGNTSLAPERLWQVDLGIRAEFQSFRGGFNAFCSIIEDYITYAAVGRTQKGINIVGANALTVQFVNTDLATLTGFEIYGELDYTDYLTPFVTMSYVDGRDHSRSGRGRSDLGPGVGALGSNQEPLPGIPPLETRMGLRFHEARPQPRWGVELASRFVASQERVASSLLETRSSGFAIYDVRTFWRARQGLLLTAGVENVFDRNYREHLDLRTGLGVFQPGINGYFGVEMRY